MAEYIYYKIVSKDDNIKEIYIGKTTNFKNRVRDHKSRCNNENGKCYNLKIYQYIRENGGWNNFDIIEIEKSESALRERELIEELNANLNSYIPTRTLKEYQKEYYKNNIEKIKEYYDKNRKKRNEYEKEYRKNNKEKIKEKIICECGCKISKNNLSRHLKSKKHLKLIS